MKHTSAHPYRVLGLALALACVPAGAKPARVDGFSHVRSLGGIHEYRLDSNGLTVLLAPDASVPVVTFQVTYRVGSRNEVSGTTGATHLLEHLMFKGNDISRYLEAAGAAYNATTWLDRTSYFATLDPQALEGYVAIEADRMRNLRLNDADRQDEMTVVRNELERAENSSGHLLTKEVYAAAYLAHPYHHPTIGWRSDIENVSIDSLRGFYDTFYWPDNATVSIVGNIEPEQALALVRRHFGRIPRSQRPIPQVYTQEPPQNGPRRVVLRRAGALGLLMIAYKGPHGRHEDLPALTVLAEILGIGNGSRFARELVDTSLATFADAGIQPTHDPGLFVVRVMLAPEATHEQVEKAVLAQIERVKNEGVSAEEVARVIARYRAEQAYARDGTMGVAGMLNEWIAVGDWTLYFNHPEQIATVTAADVQRVAREYLLEDRSTTGWFVPVVSP